MTEKVNKELLNKLQAQWGKEITEEKVLAWNSKDKRILPYMVKIAGALSRPEGKPVEAESQLFDLKKIEDTMSLYETISPIHDRFVNDMNSMMEDGSIMLGMTIDTLIGNDDLAPDCTDKEVTDLHDNMNNDQDGLYMEIIPAAAKALESQAQWEAAFHFAKDIDKNYLNRPEEQKTELLNIVKEHPKEVLALYLINAQNKEEKKEEAKIFNAGDLKAKLESKEVKDLASQIDLKDLTGSLSKLGKEVHSCDNLDKRRGLGKEVSMENIDVMMKKIGNDKEI